MHQPIDGSEDVFAEHCVCEISVAVIVGSC